MGKIEVVYVAEYHWSITSQSQKIIKRKNGISLGSEGCFPKELPREYVCRSKSLFDGNMKN